MNEEAKDWLLLIGADSVVEAVEGGAPSTWVRRRKSARWRPARMRAARGASCLPA